MVEPPLLVGLGDGDSNPLTTSSANIDDVNPEPDTAADTSAAEAPAEGVSSLVKNEVELREFGCTSRSTNPRRRTGMAGIHLTPPAALEVWLWSGRVAGLGRRWRRERGWKKKGVEGLRCWHHHLDNERTNKNTGAMLSAIVLRDRRKTQLAARVTPDARR